jgi:GNAT superfamily N-acetyltransferase
MLACGFAMIHIRLMTPADVALGMKLKTQAGWNQLEADWQRMLALQPDGCFVAELNGQPVGTTVAVIFDAVAWIAMVLVESAVRSRGVGKALMEHALAFLDGQGVGSVRLDATPLGQPLYEKLGFVEEYRLARYDGVLPAAERTAAAVTRASPEQWEALCRFDRAITRTDRTKLLQRLFTERPDSVRMVEQNGKVTGFMAVRPGSKALQMGPCLAEPEIGPMLFADTGQRHAGQRVYLDVPLGNEPSVQLAERMGLQVQRHLVRMGRGPRVNEDVARLWASSGPELG